MRRKDEQRPASKPSAAPDETAYEDNWYRSLKALSEWQDEAPTESEDEVAVEETATDDQMLTEELQPEARTG